MLLKSSQAASSSDLLSFGTPERHNTKSEERQHRIKIYACILVEAIDDRAVLKEQC